MREQICSLEIKHTYSYLEVNANTNLAPNRIFSKDKTQILKARRLSEELRLIQHFLLGGKRCYF